MSQAPIAQTPPARRTGPNSRPKKIRVLHIIQSLNYGGMERLLADIARGIDRDRFDLHVLAIEYLGRFAAGLEGIAGLHTAPPMSRWSMAWPRALAERIRAIQPDVVHTHSGVWYKASLAARFAGVSWLVHTEHGRPSPDPWPGRLTDALAARRSDIVIAVSDALRDRLIQGKIARAERIRVVTNGVDTDEFRPRADDGRIRRALGLPAHTPIIGSIGRLERIKGYDIMIRAFARLHEEWPKKERPVLIIGGEGSERASLEQLARDCGVAGAVHLLGWRDDIDAMHASFSLFTMSSRSEGTSVSLLEAMSAGLCPVVTNVGGNAAVLGDELRHRLVAVDADRLSSAWRNALLNEEQRAADGVQARQRVATAFALPKMVSNYERLYERLG